MPEEISPEEKLLKIIRPKPLASAEAGAASSGTAPKASGGISFFSGTGLTWGEQFLVGLGLALLSYFLFTLFASNRQVPAPLAQTGASDPVSEASSQELFSDLETLEYYLAPVRDKDIFGSLIEKKAEPPVVVKDPEPPPEPVRVPVTNITQKLRVVGIILDSNPEAILEDLEKKESLFLHKGDRIRDAVIEDIQEGKIILKYEDQTIELVQ